MSYRVLQLAAVDITLYKFVLPLMKQLRQEGYTVMAASKDLGYLKHIRDEGFAAYDLPMTRKMNPVAILISIWKVYRLLKTNNIDIVHVHTPIAGFVGRVAALFAGVSVKIYTAHGFVAGNQILMAIEKWLAKHATELLFTVNSEDRALAVEGRYLPGNRIIDIQSVGVNTRRFDPDRNSAETQQQLKQSLGNAAGDPVIGYIGRIVEEKGVLDLLAAFLSIRKDKSLKLLLVGPWDWDERDRKTVLKLKGIIEKSGLEQEVLLFGYREDIVALLGLMDVFVLPSYREGMPVSLLEAMAMEVPVIATNIRGCREEVDRTCGLLYEPRDVDGLAAHLTWMLENPAKASEMGRQGRMRVQAHFDEEQVLDRQIKAYREMLGR